MSERGTWEQFNRRMNDIIFVESVGTPIDVAREQAFTELGVEHECQLQREELIDHDPWVCFKCKQPIPHAYPEEGPGPYGLSDNGLTLSFEGGYGEFIDHIGTQASLVICHECAHALAEFLGLDVRNWHTHSTSSGQHEDHHTWGRHEPD